MIIYTLDAYFPLFSDVSASFVHSFQVSLVNSSPRMGEYSEYSIRARGVYMCGLWCIPGSRKEAQSETKWPHGLGRGSEALRELCVALKIQHCWAFLHSLWCGNKVVGSLHELLLVIIKLPSNLSQYAISKWEGSLLINASRLLRC